MFVPRWSRHFQASPALRRVLRSVTLAIVGLSAGANKAHFAEYYRRHEYLLDLRNWKYV
jgi:hypothetical protein